MTLKGFKRSMGLLGFGQAQFLSERIFSLITSQQTFNLIDFIKFLNFTIHGNELEKAKLSFNFIDKQKKNMITYEDIASIVCQISFLWNYLTGEKTVPSSNYINHICKRLGMTEHKTSINFLEYLNYFQNEFFNWFDFFNNNIQNKKYESKKKQIDNRQIEQVLKVFHNQIYNLILQVKQNAENLAFSPEDFQYCQANQIKTLRGPLYIDSHTTPLRGDAQSYGSSDAIQTFETLFEQLNNKSNNSQSYLGNISIKLQNLYQIGKIVYQKYDNQKQVVKKFDIEQEKIQNRRTTIINKGKPINKKSNYVYFGHENWNLIINMMLGIRKSVKRHYSIDQSEFNLRKNHILEQYKSKYTYEIINKKYQEENYYTFIDYAPKIFFHIRLLSSINNQAYLRSIGPENLIGSLVMGKLSTLTEQVSSGKSGSFFYYTQDSKFLVKTISKQEYKTLKNILQKYHEYIEQNPKSFITKIFGFHKLKRNNSNKKYYFVVINNIFQFPLQIDIRYDIKGSTHNRTSKNQSWQKNIALKDLDLMNNDKVRNFNMLANQKLQIFQQIKKDVHFFSFNNIIDYSLLIGIHKIQNRNQIYTQYQKDPNFRGYFNKNKTEIYFLGLIDIFTQYNTKKIFENHLKHLVTKGVSCVPPLEYEKRFIDFIYTYVFSH